MTFADGGTGEVHTRQLALVLPSGEQCSLAFGRTTVGSGADTDLRIDDASVSRHHVALEPTRGGVMVRDLASKNGTRVAGVRVKEALVPPGRSFQIGQVEISVRWDEPVVQGPDADVSEAQSFVTDSPSLRRAFDVLARAAPTSVPIALQGRQGVGRDTLVRRIHDLSGRDKLVTWDLKQNTGLDAEAGNTVHVLGLANAPESRQLELLRAFDRLQARWVTNLPDDVDQRLVEGPLRADVFYRVAVVRVRVPPLAERLCDVPRLALDLLRRHGGPGRRFTPAAVTALSSYAWPGNLPELDNVIRRAIALDTAMVLGPAALFGETSEALEFRAAKEQVVQSFEKQYVESLLARHEGNISHAAAEAGLSRNALYALMRRVGLKS